MPNVLATAFVSVKMLGGGIGKDLTKELEAGGASAKGAGDKAGKSWMQGFQSSGVAKASEGITLGLVAAAGEAVKSAATFQASMTRISTQAGVAKSQLGSLSAGVLKLAGQVGEDPDSLAESLYHVESNFASLGITGPKALSLVKVAAEGARVGGADLVDVTNAIGAAVASGIPGVQNFQQAMGVLNATVGAGDMKMQDLADAFGTGMVATVKGYGLSIKDVGAALAVFGDNNIRGANAGTALRVAVQALAVPAKLGASELEALGLKSNAFALAMQKGGLLPALQLLVDRMRAAGVSAKQQGDVITTIFGKKAGTGVNILADQLTRLESKYPALTKAANSFGSAWQQTLQTPAQKFKQLESSAEALGISLGTKLMPYVMDLVSWLNKNQAAVEKGAIGVAAFAVSVTALSLAMKAVTAVSTVFSVISTGIMGIAGGVTAFRALSSEAIAAAAAQKLLAVDTTALATTTGAFTVTLDGQVVATEAATAAAGELTIAEKAAAVAGALLDATNPVGWAIAAAAAVAALTVVLLKSGSATHDLIGTLTAQDKATGYNVAGYDKLGEQLTAVAGTQQKAAAAITGGTAAMVVARGSMAGYQQSQQQLTAGADAAWTKAEKLTDTMRGLGTTFDVTSSQALGLAKGADISAKSWLGSASSVDKATAKLAQYIIQGNDGLSTQQQQGALMAIFGNDAFTASTQVAALNTSWQILVGNFAGSQEALAGAKSSIQAAGEAAKGKGGAASVAGQQGFYAGLDQISSASQTLAKAGAGPAAMYAQLQPLLDALGKIPGLSAKEEQALAGARKYIDGIADSTNGWTTQTKLAAAALENTLQPQFAQVAATSPKVRQDVQNIADSIFNTGQKSQATADARAALIGDLEKMGVSAQTATGWVDGLEGSVGRLKGRSVNISVHGDGTYSIAGVGVGHGLVPGSVPGQGKPSAAGWLVTGGTAGKDSVPIMAMPGELVVPTSIVKSGAVDHLRGSIPGFAAGGIVPSYSGAPNAAMGSWAQSNIDATATIMEQSVATAAAAAIKAAMARATATFGATPGGGAPAANARLAQSLMPSWASGSEWAAWNAVAMRESGWNQFARNPGSGAYGIPQALPASKMGAAANPPDSNPGAQIKWMIGYIQGRYKDPIGAWAHEQSSGWYAKGTPGSGAAPGWGVVGEQGKELVHFAGGEHVLPASMTSKILTGKMDLPGYATGTKPPTPAQKLKAARLKELEADVGKADKLTAARNKAITTRTLQIDAQLLADLQHPKDKNGPKKVAAMRKALSSYEATSGKPINVLHQEISLLRALTGNPAGAVYGGPAPAKATTDTSSTDDSSTDDTSTDSAASAASAAVSAAQSAAAIAQWAQGIAPSVNPSSSIAVGGGGTVGGTGGGGGGFGIQAGSSYQFGGSGPAVSGAAGSGQGDPVIRQLLQQLIGVTASGPGQAAVGMRAAMSGTVTGMRQRGRYRTR